MDYRIVVGILVVALISGCSGGAEWIIDGESVYVDNADVYLNVTPHTAEYSDWVELEFESKIFSGDIDVAFGFDTDSVEPTAVQRWDPHEETVTYVCDYDFTYTQNPNYFICYYEEYDAVNETYNNVTVFEHSFDGGNPGAKTAWWNVSKNWTNFAGAFNSVEYLFDGKDTWYYIAGQNVNAGVTYKVRYYLEVNPNATDVKYDVALKPSSETIQEAIANDHFYYLDPWADYNLDNGLLVYYSNDDDTLTGTDVGDLTAYGRNGTVVGTYTTGEIGKQLQAISIEDADGAINVTDIDNELSLQSSGTINMWVNITDVSAGGRLFSRTSGAGSGSAGISCIKDSGNFIDCYANGLQNFQSVAGSTLGYTDYVMVTILYEQNPGLGSIFINGTNLTDTGTVRTIPNSDAYNFTVGNRGGAYDRDAGETIDEVAIWNRTLSQADITALYNNGDGLFFRQGVTPSNHTFIPTSLSPAVTSLNCSINYSTSNGYNATINWTKDDVLEEQLNYSDVPSGTPISDNISVALTAGENWGCLSQAHLNESGYDSTLGVSELSNITRTVAPITPTLAPATNITYFNQPELSCSGSGAGTFYKFFNDSGGNGQGLQNSTGTTYTWLLNESNYYNWSCLASTSASGGADSAVTNASLYYMNFTQCGTSDSFALNFTIIDEVNNSLVNATSFITTHTMTINDSKTFAITPSETNTTYQFCLDPTGPQAQVATDTATVVYSNAEYPARTYNEDLTLTAGTATHKLLYLLPSDAGSYSTFTVTTTVGDPISGVNVQAEKLISGSYVTISQVVTGGDGGATFWVDPTIQHRFTFSASGYSTVTQTITPTQSQYFVTLGSSTGSAAYNSSLEGITWRIGPFEPYLTQNTQYNFTFFVNSTRGNIYGCAFNLTAPNGSYLNGTTGCSSPQPNNGSTISFLHTFNNPQIFGAYYVNLSDGWILVDGDVAWLSFAVNETLTSHSTLKNAIDNLWNTAQWPDADIEKSFSAFVIFFVGLAIILTVINLMTGVESSNPGVTLVLVWGLIMLASTAGWFAIDFSANPTSAHQSYENIGWWGKYWFAVITGSYTFAWLIRSWRVATR